MEEEKEMEIGAGMGTLRGASTDLSKNLSKVPTKKRWRDDDGNIDDDDEGENEASFDDVIPSQADPMKDKNNDDSDSDNGHDEDKLEFALEEPVADAHGNEGTITDKHMSTSASSTTSTSTDIAEEEKESNVLEKSSEHKQIEVERGVEVEVEVEVGVEMGEVTNTHNSNDPDAATIDDINEERTSTEKELETDTGISKDAP
eukprot:177172_1